MSLASKKYFEIAKDIENQMNQAKPENDKKELRKVAAQNYFYFKLRRVSFESVGFVRIRNGCAIPN